MATYTTLKNGSKGNDVKKLQQALTDKGYNVGKTGVDGIYGPNTAAAVKKYQTDNKLKIDGIAGNETLGHLYGGSTATASPTTSSTGTNTGTPASDVDVINRAIAKLQGEAPGAYAGSEWGAQLNDIYSRIMNREDFSYDLNGDALYQQYKDQAAAQGQMAMMDTMGQAAAMTGGYGNSYAQSVGQQTYQGYIQGVNDKVPELYQLALDRYNREGQELYDQMSLAAAMDQQEYERHRDNVSDYYTELGLAYDRLDTAQNWEYTKERDAVEDDQWQKTFDEGVRQFNKSLSAGSSSGAKTVTLTDAQEETFLGYIDMGEYEKAANHLTYLQSLGVPEAVIAALAQSIPDEYLN